MISHAFQDSFQLSSQSCPLAMLLMQAHAQLPQSQVLDVGPGAAVDMRGGYLATQGPASRVFLPKWTQVHASAQRMRPSMAASTAAMGSSQLLGLSWTCDSAG